MTSWTTPPIVVQVKRVSWQPFGQCCPLMASLKDIEVKLGNFPLLSGDQKISAGCIRIEPRTTGSRELHTRCLATVIRLLRINVASSVMSWQLWNPWAQQHKHITSAGLAKSLPLHVFSLNWLFLCWRKSYLALNFSHVWMFFLFILIRCCLLQCSSSSSLWESKDLCYC